MKRVAVIGGGVTGLTCANQLAGMGHAVTVYERSRQAGGLAASFHRGPFSFDYGPHEFCTESADLVRLLKEVLGDDLLVCRKRAAQHFAGRFLEYPLSPLDIVLHLGPWFSAQVTGEVLWQRLKALIWSYSDHSFEQWVATRFGRTLYERYFGPYTRKVWGIDPDRLDPRTASSRIAFNSIFDYLIKTLSFFLLKRSDFSSIHSPLKDRFYYARGGIGTLTQRLGEACGQAGVGFEPGSRLVRMEQGGDRVEGLVFEDGRSVRDFDYVVSTAPLTSLLTALGHTYAHVPIRFRGMVFVFLEVPQPQVSPYHWVYFPDPEVCFQRSTEFSHFGAAMCPPGSTGLCLEISCFPQDGIWETGDADLVARARADLAQVGMLDQARDCVAHVVRRQYVYPIQITGYLETVHELLAPVRSLRNAVSTGRQGLYKYCNMNECMEMAIEVAAQIDAGVDRFPYELDSKWQGAGLERERVLSGEVNADAEVGK